MCARAWESTGDHVTERDRGSRGAPLVALAVTGSAHALYGGCRCHWLVRGSTVTTEWSALSGGASAASSAPQSARAARRARV
jgi:hypothetical protein